LVERAFLCQTEGMNTSTCISSRKTFFYKKIFPVFWFGFLIVFVGAILVGDHKAQGKNAPPLPVMFLPPIFMLVMGHFVFRKLILDLVDEVWDCGDHLLIRKDGKEERIPLSVIMNVSSTYLVNPPRVTILLRSEAGGVGREITFCPKLPLRPFARSAEVESLILRIDQARRR
jgi:hypothetical protein